jgi:hypothetical protein
MKPSIYNEYEAMTQEAMDFFLEVETLLRPVFERGQEKFNVRDIEAMICGAATAEASIVVLKNAIAKRKEETVKRRAAFLEETVCPDCTHPWIQHYYGKCEYHKGSFSDDGAVICGCTTVKPNA